MIALLEVSISTNQLLGENETPDCLGIDPKWFRNNTDEVVFYSANDEWIAVKYRAGKVSRELEKRLNGCETTDQCVKPTLYRIQAKDKNPVGLVSRARWPGLVDAKRIL